MSENIPPFYIGQRVVALKTKTWKLFTYFSKDQQFIVLGIRQSPCCKIWEINIGLVLPYGHTETICKCGFVETAAHIWCDVKYFAPIAENFQAISYEKIMEEESKFIGVN